MEDLRNRFTFCVKCMTYNHASFIVDAMNGFTMQQTNFPYVCVIVDDASTDGEQDVIRKYLSNYFDLEDDLIAKSEETEDFMLTYARHKTNHNCFFAVLLLKYNHYKKKDKKPYYKVWTENVKYVALCEGDDYWTEPLKLQKQVDFIENNPDYSLCFHRVLVKAEEGVVSHFFKHLEERDFSPREIYEKWTIPTCSVLYRSGLIDDSVQPKFIIYGDIYTWLQLAEVGKIHCLGFTGGVYRRNRNGISVKWSLETYLNLFRQYKYFEKRFPNYKDIAKRDQDNALKGLIYAPYFKGIWKYRFKYMFRHPSLFFSSFFSTTILSYTPIRFIKKKYRRAHS